MILNTQSYMWDWMGWDWVGYLPGANNNNKIRNEFYERFRIGFLTLTPSKFLREMESALREAITCSAKSLHSGGGIGRNLSHQSVVVEMYGVLSTFGRSIPGCFFSNSMFEKVLMCATIICSPRSSKLYSVKRTPWSVLSLNS